MGNLGFPLANKLFGGLSQLLAFFCGVTTVTVVKIEFLRIFGFCPHGEEVGVHFALPETLQLTGSNPLGFH